MNHVEVSWIPDAMPEAAHALALDWMQPDERARHDRFAFAHTQSEFRLARWLVRTTLARHTGLAPAALRFAPNDWGRPELVGPPELTAWRFNLSHTPGLLAIAVAHGREVGLDVEDAARPGDLLSIAHRYFAPSELAALFALEGEAAQLERFFDLWTLKEAYIKARGMGLALPLDGFAFDLGTERIGFDCDARVADDPARWHFERHRPTARHRLAIACERFNDGVPAVTVVEIASGIR